MLLKHATTGSTTAPKAKMPVSRLREPGLKSKVAEPADNKLRKLLAFDNGIAKKWLNDLDSDAILLGTDEVGRGCLAGPVMAAAVKMPKFKANSALGKALTLLNDSKKLSAKQREELSATLRENCLYAVGQASVEEIEKINILQASFLAMRRAIEQLSVPESSLVLVDGKQKIAQLELKQVQVVGGDGLSASIAAASIIAKVHRDNFMRSLHEEFPHYLWDSNKGYGSRNHCAAILERGLSAWHRKSFCARIVNEQLNLWDFHRDGDDGN